MMKAANFRERDHVPSIGVCTRRGGGDSLSKARCVRAHDNRRHRRSGAVADAVTEDDHGPDTRGEWIRSASPRMIQWRQEVHTKVLAGVGRNVLRAVHLL